ncbi:membrane protein of unknown function [Nitrospira japonica]|uniref:AlgX/AlgJ SGNH hydrolase-like domain-containing protein n=1 Tax=Nitrospira japonica TaxID=1325564 RepID=A0A1W1IB06_9BACT|nr:hypothetical protein [Nitrospira japonica]SLM50218.1 membrane protein of unknown function [Nitrospira japonica]
MPKKQVFPLLTIGCAVGLLWSYGLFVSILDETIVGVSVGLRDVVVIAAVGVCLILALGQWTLKSQVLSSREAYAIGGGAIAILGAMLALDTAYSGYLSSQQPLRWDREISRVSDRNSWVGELYPDLFYPDHENYRLHKPSRVVEGFHFGDMYTPSMLKSKTLMESVLSRKYVKIAINEDGFRGGKAFDNARNARIVALGDSFTFGWGVNEEATWVGHLERSLGETIYNLGIHDSSPRQEYLLLEHLLDQGKLRLDHGLLLWLIFEGNDLEDSYDTVRPTSESTMTQVLDNTLLSGLWKIPRVIKHQSVVDIFRSGRATFLMSGAGRSGGAYWVDGIQLATPLYRSPRFGYKLFSPLQIERAKSTREYVASHPNRSALHRTIQDMAALSKKHGFEVVMLLAPSDARLYGSYFDDFPQASDRAHFLEAVSEEAGAVSFRVVNLSEALRSYAENELLYFRDDDHWNERGHEVVAEIVGKRLNVQRQSASRSNTVVQSLWKQRPT